MGKLQVLAYFSIIMPRLTSNSVSISLRMLYHVWKCGSSIVPLRLNKSLHLEGDTVPTGAFIYNHMQNLKVRVCSALCIDLKQVTIPFINGKWFVQKIKHVLDSSNVDNKNKSHHIKVCRWEFDEILSFHHTWKFCLFGFNFIFKHLRSYCDSACLWQWYFDQCAATQECHTADTRHDSPIRHSIQTQGLEYTTTHFNVLGKTWQRNPSPTFHTHQRTLNSMMLLWW